MQEIWKPVRGYEDQYEVSNTGKVRSLPRTVPHIKAYRTIPGRELKLQTQRSGHQYIKNFGGRGGPMKWIHRLVYETFIGAIPEGLDVRHLDGDPKNNTVGNLAVGTRSENAHDVYDYGGKYKALQRDEVLAIRLRLANGERQADIAKDYKVTPATISAINTGKTFSYL